MQKNVKIIILSQVPSVPLHMTESKTNSMEMLRERVSSQCQEVIRNRAEAKALSSLSHDLGNGIFLNFNNNHIRNLKAAA